SETAADRLKDLPRPLGVDLVGHLDRIAEIRPCGRPRPAERIAAERILPHAGHAFALIALHGLLHLVHHVLGAAAQRLQRASLFAYGPLALALAQGALGE